MASRPAEGDDQDRRRQRRTEVEQVLLQHPDIVQAFVVGIPEIVAAPVELRGRVPTDPLARRDLPRKPRRRGWRPRELCRRAKSKPRRYLVAYQPLRQKATIAAASPPDRVKLGFLRHPARPGRVVRILGLSGLGNHGQIAGFADPANYFTDDAI
jgi:hypothetical protein